MFGWMLRNAGSPKISDTTVGRKNASRVQLRLTTFKVMTNTPMERAAINNIVAIEMAITLRERAKCNSIPVRPFKASALGMFCDPLNVSPGIEAEKIVLVSI